MLCDKCRRREANVHVTQIVNGVKYEQNLCSECAHAQAGASGFSGGGSQMEKLWQFLQNLGIVGVVMAPDMTPQTVHNREVDLDSLGLHLPGATAGVLPEGTELVDISALKAELTAAVTREDFERAAQLRDEIYKIEHQTDEA